MKILGFQLSVKKQPGPGSRLAVIEESLAGHEQILHTIVDRLVVVEKKAEATHRKVYRDEPASALEQGKEPPHTPPPPELQPGDIVPSGFNF